MLEMRAVVIQVHGDGALVQPLDGGGCGHCSSEGGCGSGTLSKIFCSDKPRSFEVRNEVRAKVGDEIQISLPDGVLLRGAVRMYVLPLIMLLTGAFSGVYLAGDTVSRDAYAATGAIIGLVLGFVMAKLSPGAERAVAVSVVIPRSGF
jgi:sigma-E factor negative regulatory protein RseC